MEKLLSELPGDFTRQEAVGVGASMSIPERTVDSYLARLKRDGPVRAGERFGSYTKGSRYASVRLSL